MPLIPDPAAFRARIAALPVVSYEIGETVIAGGTTSGRLLVLKKGAVEVLKDGVRLAEVSEPGVIFGELSMLLERPHTADVRAASVHGISRRQCGKPAPRRSRHHTLCRLAPGAAS